MVLRNRFRIVTSRRLLFGWACSGSAQPPETEPIVTSPQRSDKSGDCLATGLLSGDRVPLRIETIQPDTIWLMARLFMARQDGVKAPWA